MRFIQSLAFLGLPLLSPASPFLHERRADGVLPLPTQVIHQFDKPAWLENIAVRSNGQILVGFGTAPELHSIDPDASSPNPRLVFKFPNATAVFGITEVYTDIFAVVVGNFTWQKESAVPHTWSVWTADFTGASPVVKKITDVGDALWLNGAAAIPNESGTILIADSSLGAVWKLDIASGAYEIAMQYTEMAPLNFFPFIGVNGIRIHDGYLYFATSNSASSYRIQLSCDGSAAEGAQLEHIGTYTFGLDDFAIDSNGIMYAATNYNSSVEALRADGAFQLIDGSSSSLVLAGACSAAFGRRETIDTDILYVVTTGGWSKPINGSITEGGKIVAVNTAGYSFESS
ncbi:hypothetical protein IFR04_008586 [Cadophora malorum]|uniref:SMP-30/Gluconolactonase/LRE-like region domain-containing protein n=1 Tax=Cadophora malorum TaxID=108018 RepID=A0A8H7TFQ1_9HELO|nr:hypothetical protein IFR04_008586 [Cadophora malorum]